jgi:hypothetical protein
MDEKKFTELGKLYFNYLKYHSIECEYIKAKNLGFENKDGSYSIFLYLEGLTEIKRYNNHVKALRLYEELSGDNSYCGNKCSLRSEKDYIVSMELIEKISNMQDVELNKKGKKYKTNKGDSQKLLNAAEELIKKHKLKSVQK